MSDVDLSGITITSEPDHLDGGYVATTPQWPGMAGQGETHAVAASDLLVACREALAAGVRPPEVVSCSSAEQATKDLAHTMQVVRRRGRH